MDNKITPDNNKATNADLRDACIWFVISTAFFLAAFFFFPIVMAIMRVLFYIISALLLWGSFSAISDYISMQITKMKHK